MYLTCRAKFWGLGDAGYRDGLCEKLPPQRQCQLTPRWACYWQRLNPSVLLGEQIQEREKVTAQDQAEAGERSVNMWEKQLCKYRGQETRRRRCSRCWSIDSPAAPGADLRNTEWLGWKTLSRSLSPTHL